ncbi:contact-dependent growth inhibition system immunity protein [Pilimelia columellifera]|uniref:CdiI immunity protein domain-containing protein n=1 Tax=Pilimelia columellifera subsp. columellifera TaxID=706583 RepID=A0ABN3N5U2_9ACTN
MDEDRLEELKDFIGVNFGEDWDMNGDTDDAVIEAAIRLYMDSPYGLEGLYPVVPEIDLWFSADPNDETTRRFLRDEVRSYYDPEDWGQRSNEWLRKVRDRLVVGFAEDRRRRGLPSA